MWAERQRLAKHTTPLMSSPDRSHKPSRTAEWHPSHRDSPAHVVPQNSAPASAIQGALSCVRSQQTVEIGRPRAKLGQRQFRPFMRKRHLAYPQHLPCRVTTRQRSVPLPKANNPHLFVSQRRFRPPNVRCCFGEAWRCSLLGQWRISELIRLVRSAKCL